MSKISIVMPAYNAEKYINEAIDSILNQTYTDFEFIIINDGSTDRTSEIVKSYSDKRIVFVENEENMGIVYSLNKGLKLAKGEYIARMDADDIAVDTRLELQVKYMIQNLDVAVLGTSVTIFGDGIKNHVVKYAQNSDLIKANLLFHCCFAHPSVMIRKKIVEDFKCEYNLKYQGREDYALWWEIAKVAKLTTLSEPLLYYRVHSKQLTNQKSSKSQENSKKFLRKRLSDINVNLSDEQEQMLFNYCVGNINDLQYKDIINLVNANGEIIKANSHNKYFNHKYLKFVCALSVNYVVNKNGFTFSQKLNVLFSSIKLNIYSISMLVKSLRVYCRLR